MRRREGFGEEKKEEGGGRGKGIKRRWDEVYRSKKVEKKRG